MSKQVIQVRTKDKQLNKNEVRDDLENQIEEGIKSGSLKVFTYEDYLEFERRKNREYKVQEEEIKYETGKSLVYPHDKLIKTILSDKEEVVKVINKYLNLKINPIEIEKYTSSYITKEFKAIESDIVYKIKGKKIFFFNRTSINNR